MIEYKVVRAFRASMYINAAEWLNSYGVEGWQLVVIYPESEPTFVHVIFMRPKEAPHVED